METVCAVLVTYHPDISLIGKILQIVTAQVDQLLIIDNGSSSAVVASLQKQDDKDGITLISLEENQGVAKAYNIGFLWGQEHGFSHVLLLDQDSIPSPDMVRELLSACRRLQAAGPVAALGPRYINMDYNNESYFVQFGRLRIRRHFCPDNSGGEVIPADFLISSGSLIPVESFRTVGEMDESFFIDFVDTDWFLRAREKGLRAYGICSATMQHKLGDRTHRIRLPGRTKFIAQHRPERYYFIFRNSLLLCRKPYVPIIYKFSLLMRLLCVMVFYTFHGSARCRFYTKAWRGLRHGITGSVKSQTT